MAAWRGRTQAVFYRDERGKEPVDDFLEELLKIQPLAAAKIDDAIEEHLNGRDPRDPRLQSSPPRRRSPESCGSCGFGSQGLVIACSTSAPGT
jgi:hypothetical protein